MKKILLIFIAVFLGFFTQSYAAINFGITPIKYELNLKPGESITLPMNIRNNSDETVTFPTTASDFESTGGGGIPKLVRKSELVHPDQQLSSWITIEDSTVTVAPGQEGRTNFTISVPTTATPGGHYGAVIFKNNNSEHSTSGNISIDVDYGIIILVQVAGEVIVDVDIKTPIIGGSGTAPKYDICDHSDTSGSIYDGDCGDAPIESGSESKTNENDDISTLPPWYLGKDKSGNPVYDFPDDCPFGDFTNSRYDNLCMDILYPTDIGGPNENSKDITNSIIDDSFDISFKFPIENKGNTHVSPEGKIVLKDENGKIIKAIGKEALKNEVGAVVGEKIVDYIPINDQGGNVLPKTERVFESNWKGFPYKTYDDEGNQIVNYWSPSEYYTKQNKDDAGFLMFWERVSEVRTHKNITAEIHMTYFDEEGNEIEFLSAKEFPVQYIEQKVSINPYIILITLLVATAILMIWIALWWWFAVIKSHKCWNCKEKIKSHWETCPYCEAIQDKKKDKQLKESIKENIKKTTKKKPIKNSTKKVETEKKRGRGRPKKVSENKATPKKRGPGRPKKTEK